MRVAVVTTWPSTQCGIASYTQRLVRGLALAPERPDSVVVLSEFGGGAALPGPLPVEVRPCFDRHGDFDAQLVPALLASGAQVAHYQHAPDILGLEGPFTETLRAARQAGLRNVVTLHTVFTVASGLLERRLGVRGFHQTLAELCDRVIVHTESSRDILLGHGLRPWQVEVIPHGTDDPQKGDAARGRAFLGLAEGDALLLFFGFIHMQKNIHVLLPALSRLAASGRLPRLKLAIAGKPGGGAWYNKAYLSWLRRRAAALGIADRVVFQPKFIPDDVVPDLHAAAGALALPYNQGYASASGVVHGALAMGVPPLCSRGPKFEEVERHLDPGLLVGVHDVAGWAAAIERLFADAPFRARIGETMAAFADATRWPVVAARHARIWRGGR